MRTHFSHFYALTPKRLSDLSKTAVIAFDASFLLDLYRYSPETVNQMFLVLEGLADRIWLPHQAAYEFHNNRIEVISRLKTKYEELLKRCREDGGHLVRSIETDCAKHPHLDAKDITAPIVLALSAVEKKMKAVEDKHQAVTLSMNDDLVWKKLDVLFKDRVGGPYEDTIRKKHEQDAKARFDAQIPPGFKDSKKRYPYGDYIVWRQLLDHCKAEGKPGFFVTSDVKDDWWQESMGAKLGALPHLREEFTKETGHDFQLYETTNFIKVFAERLKIEHEHAVEEISRVKIENHHRFVRSAREAFIVRNGQRQSLPLRELNDRGISLSSHEIRQIEEMRELDHRTVANFENYKELSRRQMEALESTRAMSRDQLQRNIDREIAMETERYAMMQRDLRRNITLDHEMELERRAEIPRQLDADIETD